MHSANGSSDSIITCPHCGHAQRETMPSDACQWFYACTACHALLRPKPGDCCVFCSYGSVKCPSRAALCTKNGGDCGAD